VALVDDDPMVRRVLRTALALTAIEVIAEAENPARLREIADRDQPDIVLIDADMPDGAGLAAALELHQERPAVRVVFLASGSGTSLGFLALRAGGVGYLRKDLGGEALSRALRGVARGEAAISRRMTAQLIERLRTMPATTAGMRPVRSTLTAREWHVLDLLCEGASTDAIAERLVLSRETVRSHIKRLMAKIGAHSREEAVRTAARIRHAEPAPGLQLDDRSIRQEFRRIVSAEGFSPRQSLGMGR